MSTSFTRAARLAPLPAALLTAALLTGCGSPAPATVEASEGFPMTISSCGRDVTFTAPPRRVVTVGSVAAPLIAAAGAADRVVTRTFETAPFPGQYADALKNIEVTAPTGELAREEIINRTPDLVVSYEGAAVTPDDLARVNIPLLVTRGYCRDAAGSYDDIFADIELYGRLFGTSAAASAEVTALKQRVAAVADRHPADQTTRPAAALIISRDGAKLSAYGSTSTVATQMRLLGLDNVFGDVAKRSFDANTETLIQRDPEVIILLTQGTQTPESARNALRERPELAGLRAIRDNRIIAIPFGYTGPGPVAVEGLEVLDRELGEQR
ncbi:iron complex transport system substrate-binding protein [Nocardia amikacinitolerans]|uniref:Iron complex transport system substrate-binding protein n=1 Tax=Nocardia amikacinitolerans TaxID=756689 RepID=A0A285KYZ7_9NOCA|nr:ABC transporter substrate-binding protein [Nocardia amikacinitolerans]SNY77869.1 iron complex transport system substrate-binding protein [Nocardia amikacinitolerans]